MKIHDPLPPSTPAGPLYGTVSCPLGNHDCELDFGKIKPHTGNGFAAEMECPASGHWLSEWQAPRVPAPTVVDESDPSNPVEKKEIRTPNGLYHLHLVTGEVERTSWWKDENRKVPANVWWISGPGVCRPATIVEIDLWEQRKGL